MPFESYVPEKKTYTARSRNTGNVSIEQEKPSMGGFFGWAIDKVLRTNYASANVMLDLVNKGNFTPFKSAWEGFSGKEKTLYDDVLEESGMKKGWARSGAGLALDIVLDPLTYTGVGAVGKFAKAAKLGKFSGKTLNKSGVALFTKYSKKYGDKAANSAVRAVMKTEDGIAKFAEKASINWMGQRIIPGEAIAAVSRKTGLSKLGGAVRKSKVGTWFGTAFIPKFKPSDISPAQFAKLENVYDIYKTAERKGILDIQSEIIDMGKNLTKKDRQLISNALRKSKKPEDLAKFLPEKKALLKKARPYEEAAEVAGITPERMALSKAIKEKDLVGVAGHLRSRMNMFWKEEHKRGLIDSFQAGYVPGLYKKTQGMFTRYSRPKIFSTPEEAAAQGYLLIKEGDISSLYAIRGISSSRQVAAKDFYERLKNFSDFGGKHLGGVGEPAMSAATIAGKTTVKHPYLSGYWFDKAVARQIDEFSSHFTDEATKGFFSAYDRVLGFWKGSVTAPFPSFHARNLFSNTWLAWLSGVNPVMLPVRMAQAKKVQKVARAMKTGNVEAVAKYGKEKIGNYTIADIVNKANMTDVISGGFMGREIAGTAVDTALDLAKTPKGLKAAVHPIRTGRKVGTFVENNSRLSVFIDRLNKGDDIIDAAMHTKKYLFDYGELTHFEQNLMRRVIPFYTWMRKNIPLELESMVKQPAKFATVGKVGGEIEKMSEDEAPDSKYLPEFIKDQFSIRLPNKGGDWKYIAPDLAFQDLASFTNLEGYISAISPLIKAPFELAANYDFFRKRQLADPSLPPDIFALEKAKKEVVNNLRVAGVFNRLTDDQKSTLDQILREIIGVYVYSFDPKTAKKYFKQRESKEKSAEKKQAKKYKGMTWWEKLIE